MKNFLIEAFQFYKLNFILFNILFFYIFYFIINKAWSKHSFFKKTAVLYKGEQRVHLGEIPRLGGLIIYIQLIIYYFFSNNFYFEFNNYSYLLLFLFPLMLLSVLEDLFNNVSYKIRLFLIFITSILIIAYNIPHLPVIDEIPFIAFIFENIFISSIFFILCLMTLANGFNFIDGMNGLLGFFATGVCLSCINLSFIANDLISVQPLFLYLLFIVCFLIINYPFGKIFLGDSGAYLLAFLLGSWIINFFGTHNNISSWNAVLIFFYPATEVIYSYFRKVKNKKSPFHPDREHLHLKIFDILVTATKKPKLSNNLTTIFLAIFWLSPPLMITWVYDNNLLIALSLFLLIFTYIAMNLFIPPKSKL